MFVLIIIIIILLILLIKNIIDIRKYNSNSKLYKLDNLSNYKNKIIYDPILINYKFNINLNEFINNNLLKYYINNDKSLIRLSDIHNSESIYIHNNSELFKSLNIHKYFNKIINNFNNILSSNFYKTASIYKNIDINIKKNTNNTKLISCLDGKATIYLYNPKHEKLINTDNIEKYAIIVDLNKDNILYIPTNWYYSYICIDLSLLIDIHFDNYFTYIYNNFRK